MVECHHVIKKTFRSTKSGAGMTQEGVNAYRRLNPGSKLSTAVTENRPGPKRAARRKSYCARSAGQMRMFPKAANDPNSRLRQARKRWKCNYVMSYLNANIPPIYCKIRREYLYDLREASWRN
jgi:hypothetical protein